jgi:hypothetical protein
MTPSTLFDLELLAIAFTVVALTIGFVTLLLLDSTRI